MERLLTNDRFIAYKRAKKDYEDPPENTLNFAYENRRYPKLARELKDSDNILKKKILEEVNKDFWDHSNIVQALMTSDLVHVLIDHLVDPDNELRELSINSMIYVCAFYRGREFIIKNEYIKKISALWDDPLTTIREKAHRSLLNLCEHDNGINPSLECGLLERLVEKTEEEKEERILVLILNMIKRLLYGEGATDRALQTPLIDQLLKFLKSKNPQLREYGAINLGALSFLESGKDEVQRKGCVLPLCELLNDEVLSCREAATIALASLSQLKAGKVEILENSYYEKILSMLDEKSEQLLLNVIELLTNVAEEPVGREMAKGVLPKLDKLRQNNEYSYLHHYIDLCVEVITWVP